MIFVISMNQQRHATAPLSHGFGHDACHAFLGAQ
jgi:hypothetical protein